MPHTNNKGGTWQKPRTNTAGSWKQNARNDDTRLKPVASVAPSNHVVHSAKPANATSHAAKSAGAGGGGVALKNRIRGLERLIKRVFHETA
jgi:hypothetical protein